MAKPASGTPLNTEHALYTSLAAAWGMLEGSDGTSADSTGNGHTLTLGTGLTWTTISGEAALDSDGSTTGQALAITSPIACAGTSPWSFAWRAKQDASDNDGMIAGNENNGGANSFIWFQGGTSLFFRSNAPSSYSFTGLTNFTADANYLLVWDQAGDAKLHLYKDGSEIGTGMSVTANDAAITFRSLASGYDGAGLFALTGTITYAYLWSGRALTSADASTLHADPYVIFDTEGGASNMFNAAWTKNTNLVIGGSVC